MFPEAHSISESQEGLAGLPSMLNWEELISKSETEAGADSSALWPGPGNSREARTHGKQTQSSS